MQVGTSYPSNSHITEYLTSTEVLAALLHTLLLYKLLHKFVTV